MANIAGTYDQDAKPNDFDQLEAGTYRAKIIASDVEPVSKNNSKGRCLNLTWQVETGPNDGKLIWQRLNMWAENMDKLDKVISIANSQFASIRDATGKAAPQNSEELHHIPCMIVVGPQKNNPQYNEVKSVKAVASVTGAPSSPPAQRQAPPVSRQSVPANSGGSAPWRKSA